MRIAIALVALASSARVCGNEEAPPPVPPTVAVTTAANVVKTPAPATHGGTVVVVDDVQLELVVKGSGEVVAYPVVAAGLVAVPPAATIEVQVPVTAGPPRPVRLEWNPRVASFEGRVVGATVVAAPADIDVQIVHQGRVRRARAPMVVIVPATVVVTGPRANVDVRGPAVDLRVERPVVDVRVAVPGVRIGVDYDDHHHHGKHKHRGRHDNGRHLGWGNGRGRH
jgi:hypothetical protein